MLADVQEEDADDLTAGAPVTIQTPGRRRRRGAACVEHVSEVVDPQRRTVEVRVRADNDDRALRPNAFVEVVPHARSDRAKRVRVPGEAVVSDGQAVGGLRRRAGRAASSGVPVTRGRRATARSSSAAGSSPARATSRKGALLLLNQIDLAQLRRRMFERIVAFSLKNRGAVLFFTAGRRRLGLRRRSAT